MRAKANTHIYVYYILVQVYIEITVKTDFKLNAALGVFPHLNLTKTKIFQAL